MMLVHVDEMVDADEADDDSHVVPAPGHADLGSVTSSA